MVPSDPLAPGDGWVKARAAGKVNLALRVGAPRADGYHPLATVFQALSIYDDIGVRVAAAGDYSVRVAGPQASLVPVDGSNLAIRAARLIADQCDGADAHGLEIVIRKAIPVTGGMAGGSANAAAVLLACADLWNVDLLQHELATLGAQLGSDVPFALHGSTALGTGRGDELVPVLSRGRYHWVLALPDAELSTPAVFRRFDEMFPDANPKPPAVPPGLLKGLASGDLDLVAANLTNDLQPAALSLVPQLQEVLDAGLEAGALAGMVSGSGPTCAFLAGSKDAAIALSVSLADHGLARAVHRATGPAPGARLQAS